MSCSILSRLFRVLIGGVALASLLVLGGARAAEAPRDSTLVIAQERIVSVPVDGKPVRATLANIAGELMRRYPLVTINIVGVDEVAISQLTLRAPPSGDQDGAVNAVLAALGEATDHAFTVSHPSPNNFLLTRPQNWEPRRARNLEIFNLKLYLEGPGDRVAIENDLREAEATISLLDKQLEQLNVGVKRGDRPTAEPDMIKNARVIQQNRAGLLAQKLQRKNMTQEETSKRIDQLLRVVNDTLQKFSPGEKMPEYEYHPGTHLLIVIGSDAGIDVTRKVVNALEKSAD